MSNRQPQIIDLVNSIVLLNEYMTPAMRAELEVLKTRLELSLSILTPRFMDPMLDILVQLYRDCPVVKQVVDRLNLSKLSDLNLGFYAHDLSVHKDEAGTYDDWHKLIPSLKGPGLLLLTSPAALDRRYISNLPKLEPPWFFVFNLKQTVVYESLSGLPRHPPYDHQTSVLYIRSSEIHGRLYV